jgi:hypothetical protein
MRGVITPACSQGAPTCRFPSPVIRPIAQPDLILAQLLGAAAYSRQKWRAEPPDGDLIGNEQTRTRFVGHLTRPT